MSGALRPGNLVQFIGGKPNAPVQEHEIANGTVGEVAARIRKGQRLGKARGPETYRVIWFVGPARIVRVASESDLCRVARSGPNGAA